MNRDNINNETAYYRLKTARRRKRLQKKDVDRKILALDRERRTLYKQRRDLGWMELDPPVARGWKRYFILREDVARSRHAPFFARILEAVNNTMVCSRKDFMSRKGRVTKKRIPIVQTISKLSEYEYRKAGFAEKQLPYFEVRYKYIPGTARSVKHYVFTEPWRFELRIEPNLVKKVRIYDTEIEAGIAQLNYYFDRRCLNPRLSHLKYGNYRWRWYDDRKRERSPLKNQPLHKILADADEQNI